MADVGSVMRKLDDLAVELDRRSKEQAAVERELGGWVEPDGVEIVGYEREYEDALDALETPMWDRHENEDAKLPPEPMRLRLARRAMDQELLGHYSKAIAKRKRLERRVAALKASVSAMQSILSALKSEMEAVR